MKKGISFLGFVPLRLEPDHRSEMISQVLFGESFSIKEESRDWLLIDLDDDASMGWVCRDSIQLLDETGKNAKKEKYLRIVYFPSINALELNLGQQRILPAGSCWYADAESGTRSSIGGRHFEVQTTDGLHLPALDVELEHVARKLVSLPYIQGGRCGFGFDAPGLMQMLCRVKGFKLPRSCVSQAELGQTINFIHEVRPGDLAFFGNPEGEIRHVGLLLEGGRILHAHHQVRIDRFDQQGIYCAEKDRYTHKLRIIKRIERGQVTGDKNSDR